MLTGVLTGVLPAECRQERVDIPANTPLIQCALSIRSSQHSTFNLRTPESIFQSILQSTLQSIIPSILQPTLQNNAIDNKTGNTSVNISSQGEGRVIKL